jgi:type II secretory pathway component GspD/PulD (secretin)
VPLLARLPILGHLFGSKAGGKPAGEAGGEPGGKPGGEPGGKPGGEAGGEPGGKPGGAAGGNAGDHAGQPANAKSSAIANAPATRAPAKPTQPDLVARRMRLSQLVDSVRDFIDPALVEGEEIKSIGHGSLMALATPRKLASIERFLRINRDQRNRHVEVDWLLLTLSDRAFAQHVQPLLDASNRVVRTAPATTGPKAQRLIDGTGALVNALEEPPKVDNKYALLGTDAAYRTLLAALQQTPDTETLVAPRLLMAPLTRAVLYLGNKISYVKDFDIELAGESYIANPVIDVVRDGVGLTCTTALLQDGRVGLDFSCGISHVAQPIPTFTTSIGQTKVTVQLPQVNMVGVQSRVELRAGQTALFALRTLEGKRAVVLLRSRIQPVPEAGPPLEKK